MARDDMKNLNDAASEDSRIDKINEALIPVDLEREASKYFEELIKGNEEYQKLRKAANEADYKQQEALIKKLNKIREAERKKALDYQKNLAAFEKKSLQEIFKLKAEQAKEESKQLKEQAAKKIADIQNDEKLSEEEKKAEINKVKREEIWEASQKQMLANFENQVASIMTDALKQIDSAINTYAGTQGSVNAALQGSTKNWENISERVMSQIGMSPFVLQEEVLKNVAKMAKDGIIYNVEQRAFIETIKDNILTSFNTNSDSLLRLIKIQQEDTTAMRLGLASTIRTSLNAEFNDSTYMKNLYDTISGAILEANSLMPADESAEFEFAVQSWLSALSSVGVSNEFVSNLAKGINYLATGDVTGLSGNNALQSLFAMGASRAEGNKSFADMLTVGLDASDINNLMPSVIKYLQSIANSTDNLVVKSAYGNIFGFSQSDLVAISNLTSQDIDRLSKATLSAKDALKAAESQVNSIYKRIPAGEWMNNLYKNMMFSTGVSLADSPGLYAAWLVNNAVEELTGGLNVPTIGVLGNMFDLEANLNSVIKFGLIGAGLMSNIPQILSAMSNIGRLSLNDWGAESRMRGRGTGWQYLTSGVDTGISQSYNASGATGDTQDATLAQQVEGAKENQKITNPEAAEAEHTFEDLYKAFFQNDVEEVTATVPVKFEDEVVNLFKDIKSALISIEAQGKEVNDSADSSRLDSLKASVLLDKLEALSNASNSSNNNLLNNILGNMFPTA